MTRRVPMLLLATGLAAGCFPAPPDEAPAPGGGDVPTTAPPPAPPTCATAGPERSPLRRLTPSELDRTLTDLLGTTGAPATRILPPEAVGGFSNNVDVRTIGSDSVDALGRLATEVATEATADPTDLLTCPGLFSDYASRVEAEGATTDVGIPSDTDMGLYEPGFVEARFDLPTHGDYTVEALVSGTSCDGRYSDWTLSIDGGEQATGRTGPSGRAVSVELPLEPGPHTVRVSFADDCWVPEAGEDANLFVDAITVSATDLPLGSTEAFADCTASWLEDFLVRAWRHPVDDPATIDHLVSLYTAAHLTWGPRDALRLVLEVVLQSPRFVYRVEDSVLDAAPGELVPLDGYEMAARLSYFLWGSMPDDTLLAAAAAGRLDTAEGVEHEARRMLDDPRAMEVVELFFAEWLGVDHIDHVEKDAAVYPEWRDHLPASFREETLRFVREVWEAEDASFEVLLTADWTMANPRLASFYGYASSSAGWQRVDRDPAHHAGVLTQGAFLASRARSYGSSPIHRGLFVRSALLCHSIPGPDTSLEIQVPDPDPTATTREMIEQHRADPACAGCHDLIDPPGLAFEHFDGIGRFRTLDDGLPVDASVELTATDVNGPYDGAGELADGLVQSDLVRACFATQWFRFAHGRREGAGDTCEIDVAAGVFADESLDMEALVLATVLSPAFRTAVGSP